MWKKPLPKNQEQIHVRDKISRRTLRRGGTVLTWRLCVHFAVYAGYSRLYTVTQQQSVDSKNDTVRKKSTCYVRYCPQLTHTVCSWIREQAIKILINEHITDIQIDSICSRQFQGYLVISIGPCLCTVKSKYYKDFHWSKNRNYLSQPTTRFLKTASRKS
jgi:hypothetical protein